MALRVARHWQHCQMTVEFLEQELRRGVIELELDGKPVSLEEQMAYLARLKAEGKSYVPCCANTAQDGQCLGIK